jgi:polyhydroxybutyrate depolymerase
MESASMSRKKIIGAVLILVSLPAALVLVEALSFYVRNRNNGSIISSGQKREYLLYVPRSYDRTKPTPLVISMHGAGGWPVQQRDLSEWNRVADSHGFIVVYPSGKVSAGPRVWHVGREDGLARDVRFISDLIEKLAASYNIDRSRIYANGMSNGGGMTFVLSCTLSDRIAAFGMVGAAQTLPWRWCTDRRAVPMIAFHGTADPMALYNGGMSWVAPRAFPDVSTWVKNWARRNRCAAKPVESAAASDVTRREYKNCADDAAVVLYTIRGGGHTWPGGQQMPEWFVGPTTRSIDASSVMWEFYRAHPLSTQNSGVGPRTILRLQTAAAVASDAMNSSYDTPRGFDNHEQ